METDIWPNTERKKKESESSITRTDSKAISNLKQLAGITEGRAKSKLKTEEERKQKIKKDLQGRLIYAESAQSKVEHNT